MLPRLVFLTALAFSTAIPIPTPGKELIYNWNAQTRVGSNEPAPFASQFNLDGKLHLQRENENSVLVQLSDLTFKLYNGELNRRRELESKALPLPQETADLLKTFRIEYDEDGKLKQITIEAGEKKFVRNMKKAIASLLQLDRKNLQLENNNPNRRAFLTEERGIYGRGVEEYNVEFQDGQILVQKMRDIKNSHHWLAFSGFNVEPLNGVRYEPVSASTHKLYTLVKNEVGGFDIKRLEAQGGVYLHILKGSLDPQSILVDQTLDLIETIPIKNALTMTNEEHIDNLEFRFNAETESGTLADLSFGRHQASQDQYVRLTQRALEDAVSFLESNQLNLEAPDLRKGQAVNRLQHLVGHLESSTLEQLYSNLEERTGERDKQILNVFQQILPQVGSRASVLFIKDLILKKKLDEDLAVDLLNKMPMNLQMTSEKLLQEVEVLADLGNEHSLNVRRAGVLSFASLVHKVFAHNQHQQHSRNMRSNTLESVEHPGHFIILRDVDINRVQKTRKLNPILDQYIKKFLNRLENAQDYPTQLLNLQALYNIRVGVNRYLEKFVSGEGVSRHVQFHAMLASMAEDLKNPERVHQIYWPIFTNRKLHVELRAGAYFILMSSEVTMGKLWNIYWVLQSEQNPELYNFVYTNLQSLVDSKNPALRELRANAARILRYIRKPLKKYLSSNYIFDYEDPKFEFGAMIQTMLISTKTSKSMYIDVTSNLMDVSLPLYSLYLKIDGLDPAVADRLPKEKIVRMNIAELEELGKIIMSLPENKDIHIEYSILQQNQVIRIGYFDQSNIRDLVNCMQNFQIENLKLLRNSLQIQYNVLSQLIMANDLGYPTILLIKSPKLTNNIFNIAREVANKITNIQGDVRLQTTIHSTINMEIYNPIADVWQGVRRINSYDQIIPANFNIAINSQQNTIKLTLNANQDQQKGTIGLRNAVKNQVYIIGDEINNFLKQSNSQSNVIEEITRGQRNKNVVNLLNFESEITGLRYEVSVFDNERPISRRNLIDMLNLALRPENINDQGSPFMGLLLSLRNAWSRIFISPGIGSSGVVIRAVPNNKISQIDLSLRLNTEINRDDSAQLPSTKINSRATLSLKQPGDKVLKTWDVNAIIELNAGHTVNNLKVQISRIIPDQKDLKICIDGDKQWDRNGVTGHLRIASGLSIDNKCEKDDVLIDINMKGEISEEQRNKIEEVQEESSLTTYPLNLLEIDLPLNYIQRQTAIRKYEYDIKSKRIPQELSNSLETLIKVIKELTRLNINQYQRERQTQIEENNLKIVLNYLPDNNEIDLQFMRPQETFRISGVQLPNLVLFAPDNYHFSKKFLLLRKLRLINSCIVSQKNILTSQNNIIEQENISENQNEWVVYLRDKNDNQKFNVAIRKIVEQQNQLGIRVVSQDKKLEIQPFGDQNQVHLNGQPLTVDRNMYRQENWFSIGSLNDGRILILNVPERNLLITYNGKNVILEVAKPLSSLEGRCLDD